ncbi:MAG: chemotaxis response regulator protein-glutamate methylesterase [Alphaproteobacteria bacterium]|nr:chemotaxis response regulator protein-glutamate methylesterase [Alphaproteobacteria bacterium]MBL7098433.1 chemotaxis response regulator protein-glutamate methylesterase [Alphaproteobacteria bacterium]
MVVDDSAVVRGYIVRLLEQEPGIEVVATCANGQIAVQQAARTPPDVIILDVEMPVMEGLTAVPKLLAACPGTKIIMASTLTQRNATVSIEALAKGATDYIPKPSTAGISTNNDFRRELIEKVTGLGKRVSRRPVAPAPAGTPARIQEKAAPVVRLRQASPAARPQALVIGSSTGGPQALITLLGKLPREINVPVMIAQHMPATFTAILAQHIGRASGRPCAEAVNNVELKAGSIYLAPGDWHFEIAREGTAAVARLDQAPPENFCRPSVNPLFRSAARFWGGDVCAVMLTGMGSDGMDGTRMLAAAGAPVIAQDEATSVVWGMPGAVATAGLCTAVLPLNEIAAHLSNVFAGARR